MVYVNIVLTTFQLCWFHHLALSFSPDESLKTKSWLFEWSSKKKLMYSSVNILLESWEMICIFLTNYLKSNACYIIASVIYNISHYHWPFRLPIGLPFIFVGKQYLNVPNSFINPVRSPHPSDEESVSFTWAVSLTVETSFSQVDLWMDPSYISHVKIDPLPTMNFLFIWHLLSWKMLLMYNPYLYPPSK